MLDYLICDILCAIDHFKYVLLMLIIYLVYNKVSQH